MSDTELNPYIYFQGNCQEAMEFYQKIFGGQLETMPYDDMPEGTPGRDDMLGKLMNATLSGGELTIRGSDTAGASAEAKKIDLCLVGSDEAKLRKIFESLSDGAAVRQPLEKMFWGDIFGQLTDKFGVSWMVNITSQ